MQQGYRPLKPGNGTAQTGLRNRRGLMPRVLAGLAVILVAAAALAGVTELRKRQLLAEIAPYEEVYAPNIAIDGISISGLRPQEAFDLVYQRAVGRLESWTLDLSYRGHSYITLSYPLLGMDVSVEQLYGLLNEAWALTHTGGARQRKAALERRALEPYEAFTVSGEISGQRLDPILQSVAQNLDAQALDAAIIQFIPDAQEPFVFQNERYGLKLDVEKTKSEILSMAASGSGGVYELAPNLVSPKVTRAQLEKSVALLSQAVTPIDKNSTENRNNNIRISLSRINGVVLKPGDTFSFNGTVGPRTYKNGFFDALEYAYGDLVTGIGGGVCQASTTLYQAVLCANLKVTDRTSHSDPVTYTNKGQDATVYYSSGRKIDLRFRNTSPGNIYLTARVVADSSNSKRLACSVRIYGQSLGEGVAYRLSSQVVETIAPPAEIIYKVDTSAQYAFYEDETEVYSKAREGYVVQTFLQRLENGSLAGETLVTVDTYQPRQAVYWKGKAAREKDTP